MDLDNIKRGLRSEIKKRENEQYATFQCNVRQMCKDVLAKLEEQESVIAELKKQVHDYAQGLYVIQARADKDARHHKYKRCLAMAMWCKMSARENDTRMCLPMKCTLTRHEEYLYFIGYYHKWHKRWLELAEKLKEAR